MNKFSLIFRLLKFVKSFAFIVILAVINGIIGNLFSIGISLFASLGLISIMGYEVNISLLIIVILMISLGCLRGLLRYFEQYSNHYIAFKILAHIRHVIFEKLRKLAPAKLETKEKGAIINQITSDVETLEVFYAHTISPILIALFVNGTIFVFISIYTHFVLGIIALIFYFIIGVFVPLIMYKISKNDGIKYRELLSKYNARTLDMINGRKDILLTNNKKPFIDESRKNTNELVKYKNINSKRSISIRGYVDLLIYFGAILIIIFGALLSINRLMNPLLIVVALIVYLSSFGPINSLANLPSNLNQTFASAKRLFVLLDEKPIIDEKNNENTFDFDELKIENLSFSYKDEETLKDVTLKIKKGESIGIVGESGSGKSTIIKLLMQFYPYEGSIKFNNLELNEIDHDSLYQNVSMFTQNTYLFNDSIKNNIKIAKPDAADQEIIEALKNASAYDFVSKLENGIETIIKEDSTNISLGEKQRLGLARVLLRKPKLLLLDEPTSNIDVFNESIILNTLKSYKKEMTIIMISHKKSTLSIVDKIYKLEDGILYD